MKMISFCNKKGGVGKTTLCKNVAYKLALDGAKVLLIDLDPQATLSVQLISKKGNNDNSIIELVSSKNAIKHIKIKTIIQPTKHKNIDIITGNEDLTNSNTIINTIFPIEQRYIIADLIYSANEETFNSYDYVLIDYPPTIQELAINFLTISDFIIIPINAGNGSYKGLIDLKNTLNYVCRLNNRDLPSIKVIFNNIKDNENTSFIYKLLVKNDLANYLLNNIIKNSDTFIKTENELSSIWTNQHYWRQKQAYEELIKEIK